MSLDSSLQRIVDRIDILDAIARASHLLNDQDVDAYTRCYQEDGVFEVVGFPPVVGRLAIREFVMMAPGVVHGTLDHVVEVLGDEAVVEHILVGAWARPDRKDCGFLETGRYRDRFVRTPEGWKLKRRTLSLDIDAGSVFARIQAGAGIIDREAWIRSCKQRWLSGENVL